jgi:hypothetical protein
MIKNDTIINYLYKRWNLSSKREIEIPKKSFKSSRFETVAGSI